MGKQNKKQVKVRRSWGDLDPNTRIHKEKTKYDRAQSKKDIQTELDSALDDNFDEADFTDQGE